MTRQDRFLSKIDKSGTCWIWKGTKRDGYGQFRTDLGMRNAHRVMWEMCSGSIPNNLQVLHRCDIRACVNPDHLFLGTLQDNMNDRNKKKRHAFGGKCGRSTISEEIARQIKSMLPIGSKAPWGFCKKVADMFGIKDTQTVTHIWHGRTWRHL